MQEKGFPLIKLAKKLKVDNGIKPVIDVYVSRFH